jgi:hypothetical protein
MQKRQTVWPAVLSLQIVVDEILYSYFPGFAGAEIGADLVPCNTECEDFPACTYRAVNAIEVHMKTIAE